VLAEFNKFPFEHFTWGQALVYYNRVSTVTKDRILGKAWEAQLVMLAMGKKCLAESMKKWLLRNQPYEVASFLPPVQPSLETAPQFASTCALQAGCRNPTLAKCGGEAQHLEKLEIWSPPGLTNV